MPRFPKPYAAFVQRLRVPTGFVLLACFGFLAHPSVESILASLPVVALGLALRAWAAGHLEKDRSLAESGPYAYTRNPLYLGTFIVALGFAVGGRSWILAGIFTAAFLLIYLPVMEREEEHLLKIFPAYRAYAARVPLLWPKPAPQGPQNFRARVYRKNEEYKASIGALAGLAVLAAKLYFMGR
ncbi:MAG TPA: isoprenylcysteine carboxylmethyltransferase family protein [Bryobacteraceae bacterium]|jgi:protein-S-isoprenylcysteine O-methyltransferase Ste14